MTLPLTLDDVRARSRARAAAIRELVAAGDLERDWLDVAADIEAEAATA